MFRFTPQTIPGNIFVIGCGGTGSRLMPMLAQFIRSITRGVTPTGWLERPTIWAIDDDVVESKNLLRQNFIQNDVGKPKATVVAERYSRAYDVDIVPVVKRVDSTNNEFDAEIQNILLAKNPDFRANNRRTITQTLYQSSMVIICVDSSAARRHILNTFFNSKSEVPGMTPFVIDAGNEDSFGQVHFFTGDMLYGGEEYDRYPESEKLPKLIGSVCDISFLPMDVKYYQNLVDTESTASCADLNQTLAINALMATNIMGVVQNYYYRKQFTYNCIRISLDGGNSTEYNSFNNLKRKSLADSSEATRYIRGDQYSTEKDGRRTNLAFARCLNYDSVSSALYAPLQGQIRADERAAAEERRRLEAEERAKATAEKNAKLAAMDEQDRIKHLKAELKKKHGSKTKVEVNSLFLDNPATTVTVEAATPEAPRRRAQRRPAATATEEVAAPEAWLEATPEERMERAARSIAELARNRT